jgi:hypothetical protein
MGAPGVEPQIAAATLDCSSSTKLVELEDLGRGDRLGDQLGNGAPRAYGGRWRVGAPPLPHPCVPSSTTPQGGR